MKATRIGTSPIGVNWSRNIQFIMSSGKPRPQMVVRAKTVAFSISRLKIMESARTHLAILGCIPIDQRNWPPRLQKVPINRIHIGFVFSALILNLSLTFWYYIREVKTFVDLTESVFWSSRSILSLILYSMLVSHRSDLIKLFDELEEMVDKRRQKSHAPNVYEKTNEETKNYPNYCYAYALNGIFIFFMLPTVCRSYINYFTSDYSVDSFQLFYHIVLPFNWKSPIGYIFAVIIQLIFFIGVIEIFVTVFIIYLSICAFGVAFATDIELCFRRLKCPAELCFGAFSPRMQSILYRNLCDIVRFHADAVQFTTAFSKFYRKFMSMFFIISTSYLTIFFLRTHLDIQAGELFGIFRSLIRTMAWIIGFYSVCKFGDDVTHRFHDISNSIYECPWYEMPIKIKKHFPMMMAISQKPIHMYGCLNIRCSKITFRKIIYAAFSYFMVLQEIV